LAALEGIAFFLREGDPVELASDKPYIVDDLSPEILVGLEGPEKEGIRAHWKPPCQGDIPPAAAFSSKLHIIGAPNNAVGEGTNPIVGDVR
jgi:hypothetical protein